MLRKLISSFILALLIAFSSLGQQLSPADLEVELPEVIVGDVKQAVKLKVVSDEMFGKLEGVEKTILLNSHPVKVQFFQNEATILHDFPKSEVLSIAVDDFSWERGIKPIPLWMSVLPPLIAIMMALLLKEVFSALFTGLLVGTSIIWFYKGSSFFVAIFKGLLAIIDTYVMQSLLDSGHMSIIIFSMVIGGMVHLITRNGGMKGVVNWLSKYASNRRSGQLVTWALGIMIFFDDYANTLVVGNTMRPVTDRLKISREKLAYIVDSTAAPVAATAFVTTWIGAELSYIQDGLSTIGLDKSAYQVFFNSLAYSYYPFLALLFIPMLVWRGVEFGPMLKAEQRAIATGVVEDQITAESVDTPKAPELEVKVHESKARAINAVVPVFIIIFGTITGLLYTGWDAAVWDDQTMSLATKVSATIGNSNSYAALLWSSLCAMVVAVGLTLTQRLLTLRDTAESLVDGFKMMLTAILILTLAWSIAMVTDHMHTADFLSALLLKLSFSPYLIPALTFVLAALVAFSTGSSWGTMAILYPLILPATWLLTNSYGFEHDQSMSIFYNVVSCVLAGSVLGDHCSPISDTTILSSLASNCNHIEHVRTQMPYALTVGGVAIFVGTVPAAFGVPGFVLFPLAIGVLFFIIRVFGRKAVV
jgi:Na+/H+ antiporter NhaC